MDKAIFMIGAIISLGLSVYELSAVSGTTINVTAFIIYACINLLPARAKYLEYKLKICAKGVFRSTRLKIL